MGSHPNFRLTGGGWGSGGGRDGGTWYLKYFGNINFYSLCLYNLLWSLYNLLWSLYNGHCIKRNVYGNFDVATTDSARYKKHFCGRIDCYRKYKHLMSIDIAGSCMEVINMHAHAHMYTHTDTHVHTHVHTHIHMYKCTNTHTQMSPTHTTHHLTPTF